MDIVAYVTAALFIVAKNGRHNGLLIGLGVLSVVLTWLMIHGTSVPFGTARTDSTRGLIRNRSGVSSS